MSTGLTVGGALRALARRFRACGIESAVLDAQLIVGCAVGLERARLCAAPERRLSAAECARVEALAERRARREPMAYLLGAREFWSLRFSVGEGILVPRPESETLIEAALEAMPERNAPLRVLDLGTGSGCLLLALLTERPRAMGLGVDRSARACALARANAAALGLSRRARFIVGDWGAALGGEFDLIVANPPYVAETEAGRLVPEIGRYEPREALFGGRDGLSAYRALAPDLARLLAPGGVAVVEHGAGQGAKAAEILEQAGLRAVARRADLAAVERCVLLNKGALPRGRSGAGLEKNSCKAREAD